MRISKETDKQDCLIVDFTVSAESGLKQFPELYRLVTDLGSAKVRAMNPTAKKLKVDRKQYQHDAMFDEAEEVPPTGDTDDAVVDPQKTAELIQAMLKLAEENAILRIDVRYWQPRYRIAGRPERLGRLMIGARLSVQVEDDMGSASSVGMVDVCVSVDTNEGGGKRKLCE